MSSDNDVVVKYLGPALPTGSNAYTILDTVAMGFGKNWLAGFGLRKFKINMNHSGTLSLTSYVSHNRGTTWVQVQTESITSPGTTVATVREYLCEGAPDFKVVLTNGGSDQTVFGIHMSFTPSRNAAS